jgi:hypothetical protein
MSGVAIRHASFDLARNSLVSYVFIRVCSVSRATSYRPFSISLMALSNRILSGCSVSAVIGFSYFWRRNPQELSNPSISATTANLITIVLEKTNIENTCLFKHERP